MGRSSRLGRAPTSPAADTSYDPLREPDVCLASGLTRRTPMTISRPARAVAAAAALTLTALAMTSPAHASAQRATDPFVGAPTVGTCSTMTPKQAAAQSDHSAAGDCTQAHTAVVAGVVKLP